MLSFYDYLILSHLPLSIQWQIDRSTLNFNKLNNITNELKIAEKKVEKDIYLLAKNKIKVVTYLDDLYPNKLRNLDDAPFALFYKGSLEYINNSISIIGPRKPTIYAKNDARSITYYFINEGYSVVSGLAIGCDSIVHNICTKYNKPTYGILSCGHLINYPKNSNLKDQIITNGAIISELWPNNKVVAKYIPYRNRLIAGLSNTLVILDCPRYSGTRTTLSHALNLNREIYISSNALLGRNYKDILGLVEDGAKLLEL